MYNKKILIIADSMAMPREEISYEKTWVYKLKIACPNFEFIDKTRRASTSERLVEEGGGNKNIAIGADLLEYYKPQIVITQLGLADCAPRYYSLNSLFTRIINNLPKIFKNIYYSYKHKFSERRLKYAYVSPEKFKYNWENYIIRAIKIDVKVLSLPIAPVSKIFIKKSPEISKAIEIYNSILFDLEKKYSNFEVLRIFQNFNTDRCILDEMHFNENGHDFVFKELQTKLCQV